MPSEIKYPDVNGVRTSYASIELGIDGLKIVGCSEINYKDDAEIPAIFGTSPSPIGRTLGRVTPGGSIVVYRAEWDRKILPKLTKDGTVGYMTTAWPITCTYAEESAPDDTITDRLVGVRFYAPEAGNAEGTEASRITLQLSIMSIEWAGKYTAFTPRR